VRKNPHRSRWLIRGAGRSGVLGESITMVVGDEDRDRRGKINSVTLAATTVNRGGTYTILEDPAEVLAYRIQAALDPTRSNGKVKFLSDMKPEELEALKAQYGCDIKVTPKEQILAARRKRRRLRFLKQRARLMESGGHTVLHDIGRAIREERDLRTAEQTNAPKKDEQNDDPRRG
jgi:hypothetical protein